MNSIPRQKNGFRVDAAKTSEPWMLKGTAIGLQILALAVIFVKRWLTW